MSKPDGGSFWTLPVRFASPLWDRPPPESPWQSRAETLLAFARPLRRPLADFGLPKGDRRKTNPPHRV
jgi:hypothetical protein